MNIIYKTERCKKLSDFLPRFDLVSKPLGYFKLPYYICLPPLHYIFTIKF